MGWCLSGIHHVLSAVPPARVLADLDQTGCRAAVLVDDHCHHSIARGRVRDSAIRFRLGEVHMAVYNIGHGALQERSRNRFLHSYSRGKTQGVVLRNARCDEMNCRCSPQSMWVGAPVCPLSLQVRWVFATALVGVCRGRLLADSRVMAGLEKAIAHGDGDPWDGLRTRLRPAGQKGL